MLFLRPCYSNGHEDISGSLSRITACTSELESVHSLPKELRSSSFLGPSKHCPLFSTFPCSCSSPAWLFSYGILISRFSSWCRVGSAFARLCTDASRSCQSFVLTAHTTPHSHCQFGILLLERYFSFIGFFGGSTCRFTFIIAPSVAFVTCLRDMENGSCRACKRQSKKLL